MESLVEFELGSRELVTLDDHVFWCGKVHDVAGLAAGHFSAHYWPATAEHPNISLKLDQLVVDLLSPAVLLQILVVVLLLLFHRSIDLCLHGGRKLAKGRVHAVLGSCSLRVHGRRQLLLPDVLDIGQPLLGCIPFRLNAGHRLLGLLEKVLQCSLVRSAERVELSSLGGFGLSQCIRRLPLRLFKSGGCRFSKDFELLVEICHHLFVLLH
mmetsp:Transcript_10134/g.28909  ORF Transcript_10134/g.28909 Transcript_10134/m.28909 type:complete len:211 (-) Transcript_10134:628-1260(-)